MEGDRQVQAGVIEEPRTEKKTKNLTDMMPMKNTAAAMTQNDAHQNTPLSTQQLSAGSRHDSECNY